MKIKLTKQEEEYIENLVFVGVYKNMDDLIKDALKIHAAYQDVFKRDLWKEIHKGWNGPDIKKSINDVISAKRNTEGI
ncbi:ribbon-helix-helix domain-containing protein [Zobellia laminariae]|uniref:ribbon-helix-helix domain-containing protein n=1 Tax=Zobellia laminariae TaxID=248906 RepID=UPI003EF25860